MKEWKEKIEDAARRLKISGSRINIYSAGKAELLSCILSLIHNNEKPVVVLPNARYAQEISKNMDELKIKHSVLPDVDILPFEPLEPSKQGISSRIEALNALLTREKVIVTDVMALLKRTAPPRFLKEKRVLSVGEQLPNDLIKWFVSVGYTRTMTVRSAGEFAVRGNVVDFFSPKSGPVRVETFDVDIESLRIFDPETQLSVSELRAVELLPFMEICKSEESLTMARERLQRQGHFDLSKEPAEKLQGMNGLFWKDSYCGLDYIPESIHLVIYNFKECKSHYEEYEREIFELYDESFHEIYKRFSYAPFERFDHIKVIHISKEPIRMPFDDSFAFSVGIDVPLFFKKQISRQFVEKVENFSEIEPGSLVVHSDHGIGVYQGTQIIEDADGVHEYLKILYKNDAVLYVPVEKFTKINKYIGSRDKVALSDINGREWRRTKEKVKADVEADVRALLRLYAMREESRGFSFSKSVELEEAFSNNFGYIETPDQEKALEDVFSDMASMKPMDRLICGDAGFGKTEIALRAAFRAVVNGKQVAVLVPTTVLARQHYNLFLSRMEPFGVKVSLLSSQVSASEKAETIKGIANGKTDIVIGTHSLISGKVSFKDLGLVIIDEEQRFGTKQKESLKKLRLNVDVLTLAATPIPRTLHMALAGIKEMSVIQTPPIGRSAPRIYAAKWNEKIVQSAILREVNRGGQVFYIHNKVEDLGKVAEKLKKLLPSLNIACVHGQMPKVSFIKAVDGFYSGNIDVLVATSVVENGIDVPNANTLIVDDVERYGLGQLYQLKGRVGRSDKRAFVYLMYFREPSPLVRERLNAISKYSDPGSAMELALKDMEIRGVGEVLGLRQHGHIDSVGLQMYRDILKRTISKLKGEDFEKDYREVDVELPSSVLPSSYIPDSVERMKLYRRLASVRAVEEVDEIIEEMRDRFGPIPSSAETLLDHSKIRALLLSLGIESIKARGKDVEMIFAERDKLSDFSRFYKECLTNPSKNVMILRGVIVKNDLKPLLKILLNYKNNVSPKKEGVA